MLKCHLDYETNTCKIEVKGNLITILTDMTYLIHDIYLECLNNNPRFGAEFQYMLRKEVGDDSSPVWEVSDTYEAEEDGVKSVSVRIPRNLRDLLDALRGE